MLLTALTAALEAAFNTWLRLDARTHGDALVRLQALQGKLVCLHIQNPALPLYFLPTTREVKVSAAYDAEPDVTIHGTALAFMRLSQATDAGKGMLENGIKIDGDLGLGEQFSQILREVDVDWEALLAQAVGDILAHQVGQLGRDTHSWLESSAEAMRLNTREYLQEEAHWLPTDCEIRHFLDEIDTLRMDTDRLEARIKRLESNFYPRTPS